jgi:hypothetical protein
MGPKLIKKNEETNALKTETNALKTESNALKTETNDVKPKRGRKSKQELMASLNMTSIIKETDKKENESINLNVNEINLDEAKASVDPVYELVLKDEKTINDLSANLETENNVLVVLQTEPNLLNDEQKPISKKRGRKPKGGKIIQQVISNNNVKEDKPNIILHLKCSMKDLLTSNQSDTFMESYNFQSGKHELPYEIISNENINTFNDKVSTSITNLDHDYDDDDDESVCKDVNKEIWKKIKQLEHNLHINNVNNKKSACFWDTCEFDNPPIYIPKHYINNSYHVYGCFCSPECGVAYLMNENIDSSTKFERYHLFNHIYSKIYDYKKNIKPAPNPFYMLERYYGNLSIQEYRALLRNERLFLIVDKPLTRILPELHEDNDDFILNNKIIPSNNYHNKARLQRKKQNKTSIVNEKFGIANLE